MTLARAPRHTLAPTQQLRVAILGVFGCGLLLAVLQRGFVIAMAESPTRLAPMLEFDIGMWVVWLALAPAIVAAARRWPLRDAPVRDAIAHVIAAMVVSAVHYAVFSALLFWHSDAQTGGRFLLGAASMLSWRLAIDVFVYTTVVAVTLALDSAARARAEELGSARAATESAHARLHALQMQIEPHFLFNALNTAAMLARSGNAGAAADVITRLSEMLRELVDDEPGAQVSVRDELAFVERYLAIERARFGERLRVTISAARETLDVRVPRLMLQPIVENAVHHGLSRSPTSGAISVETSIAGAFLVCRVTDDGPGPEASHESAREGRGLGNTRARLAVLYGDNCDLTVEGTSAGAVVTMRIPVAASHA